MATVKFETDNLNDMIKRIESFAGSEEVYIEAISSGTEIMKNAIQTGASKHRRTGAMAKSLKTTKPVQNKYGDWVGRVKFTGSDGVSVSKSGNKFDRTNWIKAFRIEYGTSKQTAKPFVRPAIQSSESKINEKMKQVFDRKLSELQ